MLQTIIINLNRMFIVQKTKNTIKIILRIININFFLTFDSLESMYN